jgi:methylated-DNA-protein-cysteine methyltransferase related protein
MKQKSAPSHHMLSAMRAVVATIPPGRVMSYGAVARAAGFPRHARMVARALSEAGSGDALPWHRVINAQGRIPARGLDGEDDLQRMLLEAEGIDFDERGRVDMAARAWSFD